MDFLIEELGHDITIRNKGASQPIEYGTNVLDAIRRFLKSDPNIPQEFRDYFDGITLAYFEKHPVWYQFRKRKFESWNNAKFVYISVIKRAKKIFHKQEYSINMLYYDVDY